MTKTNVKVYYTHGLEELILTWPKDSRQYADFSEITIKMPKAFFFFFLQNQKKKNPKFVWKHKDIEQIIIINLRKNKVGVIILPDLKLFYKPTVFKTVWY